MFCQNCGTPQNPSFTFCSRCGWRLVPIPTEAPVISPVVIPEEMIAPALVKEPYEDSVEVGTYEVPTAETVEADTHEASVEDAVEADTHEAPAEDAVEVDVLESSAQELDMTDAPSDLAVGESENSKSPVEVQASEPDTQPEQPQAAASAAPTPGTYAAPYTLYPGVTVPQYPGYAYPNAPVPQYPVYPYPGGAAPQYSAYPYPGTPAPQYPYSPYAYPQAAYNGYPYAPQPVYPGSAPMYPQPAPTMPNPEAMDTPPAKKGRHRVPILIMAALVLIGLLLFFLGPGKDLSAGQSGASGQVQEATPWFRNEDGTLYFDEKLYTGPAELTIPETVDGEPVVCIADDCFADNDTITTVVLPDTLEEIGSGAFSGCSSLRGIYIPDGVKIIGSRAFEDCVSLEAICIPSSVGAIGRNAFRDCDKLMHIMYDGEYLDWCELYSSPINSDTLVYCTDGTYPHGVIRP